MSSDPQTLRKVADVWLATALASRVLPAKDLKRDCHIIQNCRESNDDITCSWSSIEYNTFRRLNAHVFIVLRVCQW